MRGSEAEGWGRLGLLSLLSPLSNIPSGRPPPLCLSDLSLSLYQRTWHFMPLLSKTTSNCLAFPLLPVYDTFWDWIWSGFQAVFVRRFLFLHGRPPPFSPSPA